MGPTWILVVVSAEPANPDESEHAPTTSLTEFAREEDARAAYDKVSIATDPTVVAVYLAPVRSMSRRG